MKVVYAVFATTAEATPFSTPNTDIKNNSKMPSLLTKHLHNLITCRRDGCDRKHVSNWLVITLSGVFKEPECNPPSKIKVDSQT